MRGQSPEKKKIYVDFPLNKKKKAGKETRKPWELRA